MKKLLILLLLTSFNVSGAGTESSNSDSKTTPDQINSLYELAEKHIYNKKYDKSLKLLKKLSSVCNLPMIASGGAGCKEDFISVFKETNVDGALAASIFHSGEYSISQIKSSLVDKKINMRI